MTSISNFLAPDHKYCDELFSAAETAVGKSEWERASADFSAFCQALRHHFAMEEEVMFPAFEERTGMQHGPTTVMRAEHCEMDALLEQMTAAVASQRQDAFLGDAETLLILMQQHNIKEEQMLYRMADQVLGSDAAAVVGRMRTLA